MSLFATKELTVAVTPSMTGKTVLITGGTGGIGRAAAIGLASMGARMGITGRDRARAERAAAAITRESGNPAVAVFVADMSSQTEVRRLAAGALTPGEIGDRSRGAWPALAAGLGLPRLSVHVEDGGVPRGAGAPAASCPHRFSEDQWARHRAAPNLRRARVDSLLRQGLPAATADAHVNPENASGSAGPMPQEKAQKLPHH